MKDLQIRKIVCFFFWALPHSMYMHRTRPFILVRLGALEMHYVLVRLVCLHRGSRCAALSHDRLGMPMEALLDTGR